MPSRLSREHLTEAAINQAFMDKIDADDWLRADGRCICSDCGKEYRHRNHPEWEPAPSFRMLCDGRVVKL